MPRQARKPSTLDLGVEIVRHPTIDPQRARRVAEIIADILKIADDERSMKR